MALQPFVGPWPLFQTLNLFTESVRLLGRGDQPVASSLTVNRVAQTQNKRTQTSMSQVGFEPRVLVFERAKTVNALDRTANVIGLNPLQPILLTDYPLQSCASIHHYMRGIPRSFFHSNFQRFRPKSDVP
jgi:hypothetical protein